MSQTTMSLREVLRAERDLDRRYRDGQKRKAELAAIRHRIDTVTDYMENHRPSRAELLGFQKEMKMYTKRAEQLGDRTTLGRRLYFRKLRNLFAVAVMVLVFVQCFGVPNINTERGLMLRKLEKPVWVHGQNALTAVWSYASQEYQSWKRNSH